MKRRIIEIDQDLCNGCEACVQACHEGAIGMKEGKAVLLRDDYCDGLGDCLPTCPTGAIRFVEREALAFDKEAVENNMKQKNQQLASSAPVFTGCPGKQASRIKRQVSNQATSASSMQPLDSQLMQWPVQIKLVPVNAPYFDQANLLIAADCTAFAYGNFHQEFMRNKIAIIGCPKLDQGDYADKLTEILKQNDIKSVTVVRMQVPCCGGIEQATKTAMQRSNKWIPWQVVTITTDGQILEV